VIDTDNLHPTSPVAAMAHYRITFKLGEDAMAEVWRATDTKLNRDIAIKILPESLRSIQTGSPASVAKNRCWNR
jgi:hypothetical protein